MTNLEDLSDEDFEKEYTRRKRERKRIEVQTIISELVKANDKNMIRDVIVKKWHDEMLEVTIIFGDGD